MPRPITSRRYQDPDADRTVVVSRKGSTILAEIYMFAVKLNEKKFSSFKRADEYLTYYGWKEITQ